MRDRESGQLAPAATDRAMFSDGGNAAKQFLTEL